MSSAHCSVKIYVGISMLGITKEDSQLQKNKSNHALTTYPGALKMVAQPPFSNFEIENGG